LGTKKQILKYGGNISKSSWEYITDPKIRELAALSCGGSEFPDLRIRGQYSILPRYFI